MNIVEGKYYRNRSGEKVGPAIWKGGHREYPWNIPWDMMGDYLHYEGGRSCLGHKEDDIVAEWEEEETMEYKTWGQMTSEEKGSLLLAYHEGKTIEYYNSFDHSWVVTHAPLFCDGNKHRVKPEPKVETTTLNGSTTGKFWGSPSIKSDTHKITFDTIDGEPDCSSVKMEKITKDDDCPF